VLTGVFFFAGIGVLGFAIYRRGFAGYPPAPEGLARLHRPEAAFVESVAEVLFPSRMGLALAGIDAGLASAIDRHLDALPGRQRFQIRALFMLIEHLTLVLPGDEPGGRARFSSLTAASRISILERLANHPQPLFRLLVTALRSVFVLGYLGHPANLHRLGLAPFEIEAAVSDAELLFPRIGGLPSSIPFEDADRTDPTASSPLDPHGERHRAYARAGRGSR
jgi:hypothetical protein